MAIGVNWAEIWAPVWDPVWVQSLVTVPDVVGQSQASATAEIEALGLVVAVATAHSSTVPAGDVISQSPTAGSEVSAGATVTITVSLGEAAVQESTAGGFLYAFEREQARRRRERKRRAELEQESERIADETTREIARILREQEAKDARRAELQRLSQLVDSYAQRNQETELNARVQKAIAKAATKQTLWALYALERELQRAIEEEQFLLSALRVFIEYEH